MLRLQQIPHLEELSSPRKEPLDQACGGAIPPRLIEDFDIPDELLVAKISSARMVSPKDERVLMPIANTFVGMVDRDKFDPWLRERAKSLGADVRTADFKGLSQLDNGNVLLTYLDKVEMGMK